MSQTVRKRVFWVMVIFTFVAVTIYEFLTPMLSDDIAYMEDVSKAGNFFDLFVQEYEHYMTHTGRSISHFILRIFLFIGNKAVFNVVAGAVFVTMSILLYLNVDRRKPYDIKIYGFVLALLWFFDAAIGDTVFWEDGACNYMFTGTIIMGFITVFRRWKKDGKQHGVLAAFGMLFFGIIAGWCNENTSGGLILFIMIELVFTYAQNRNGKNVWIKPWMLTGFVGSLIGFGTLAASPGNYGRMDALEEEHTGIMAIVARFLKITLNIKDNYLVLTCAFAVIMVLLAYYIADRALYFEKTKTMIMFFVLFLATSYALIMVPTSELRSYYGASIFLMIAVANGVANLYEFDEKFIKGTLGSMLAVGAIVFIFSYFDDGANLARIKREFDERDAYFVKMQEEGQEDITAPMLRPGWENRFSAAYRMDIQEDDEYWINTFYATHYKLGMVAGVPREEWTKY